jgi:GH25 family lysozyme M1 (1,4-beta-N-acetylmuramidase)
MKLLLAILAIATVAFASNGVDLSTLATVENFQCLVDTQNVTFVVLRGYRSFGSLDPNIKANLKNAQDAGIFFTDVYLFPCRGKSPVDQANELIDHLSDVDYNYIWVDVETNSSPGCSWAASTAEENCNFLEQMVNQISKRGRAPGIYASSYMWTQIMGSASACPKFKALPIWYPHYDKTQTFNDFTPFGGWTKPNYKQYQGTTNVCGVGVDLNWYPQCSGEECLQKK